MSAIYAAQLPSLRNDELRARMPLVIDAVSSSSRGGAECAAVLDVLRGYP